MNLSELKEIIKHLKKTLPCSKCDKKFLNDDIKVLSTHNEEALLYFGCHTCKNQLLVHVSIVEQTADKNLLNIQTHDAAKVNQDDILDIHNFLNHFNGDFKSYFELKK